MIAAIGVALAAGGCDRDADKAPANGGAATGERVAPATTTSAAAVGPRVVFLGDSITAGLGLEVGEAFPARVGEALAAEGVAVQIVNAGVSGDTTAGGLRRLDWVLRQRPDVVVVGLGANDGLRGLDLKASEGNLREIVKKCRAAGADVLLLGMLVPPNYGPEYAGQFKEVYARVAREAGVPVVPFMLQGVGGDPRMNQADGIHPTAEGQRVVARNVLGEVRELVRGRGGKVR